MGFERTNGVLIKGLVKFGINPGARQSLAQNIRQMLAYIFSVGEMTLSSYSEKAEVTAPPLRTAGSFLLTGTKDVFFVLGITIP